MAVVEDLEQDVEDVRVRLLDLVQEDQAVRLAAHSVGQLAAVVVADVAGWRADEARDVVLLHELGHVQPDQRILAAEHELGQHFRQVRLADARRPHEHEDTDRPLRILEAGPGAPHGLGDGGDRLVLAHDAVVQRVLHVQEALLLLAGNARDGDARPHAHHIGDVLRADDRRLALAVGAQLFFQMLQLLLQLHFAIAKLGGELVLLGADGAVLLLAQALQSTQRLLERRRRGGALDAHARGRLVHQVDRLVGQEAVADVARGQVDGGLERLVADRQLVVLFVTLLDAVQDFD